MISVRDKHEKENFQYSNYFHNSFLFARINQLNNNIFQLKGFRLFLFLEQNK